jgi:hypothetical protein
LKSFTTKNNNIFIGDCQRDNSTVPKNKGEGAFYDHLKR